MLWDQQEQQEQEKEQVWMAKRKNLENSYFAEMDFPLFLHYSKQCSNTIS